jgi:maltose O-acetyltransferase
VVDGSLVHVLDQPAPQADVRLGGAVFLGSHVIVTAGCTVGAGSVVGGNSVVSRDIPEGVIAVGAPAKPLKDLPHRGG